MNKTLPLSLITVLAVASATADAQQSPTRTGSLAVPANRVVGLWDNSSAVGPCGGTTVTNGRNTVIFIAGGTLVDIPRAPAGTPLQRSVGIGTWAFNALPGTYTQRVRFDWFLNGAYDGYQTVDRTFLISGDQNQISGPVQTIRYNADGSVRAQLCGSAVSTRL
jgi:hypothetical protein